MKIFIANSYKEKTVGGGFVFAHNFEQVMNELFYGQEKSIQFVNDHRSADIIFIPGPTMLNDKELFNDLVASKIPIVLRIDNAVRDSRNRGTGMSRMIKFACAASAIVYQSQWAESFLHPFLAKKCGAAWYRHEQETGRAVRTLSILNGVDTNIFYPSTEPEKRIRRNRKDPVVIYSRHNRDEVKGWHIAWYWFVEFARQNKNAALWLLGRFDQELAQYNFDFFDDENVVNFGEISDRLQYAKILRSADIFYAPYDYDACSNAVLEARASGLKILTREDPTGGLPEIIDPNLDIRIERMALEYLDLFKSIIA